MNKYIPRTKSPRLLLQVTAVILSAAVAVRVPVVAPRYLLQTTKLPAFRLTPPRSHTRPIYSKSAEAEAEVGIQLDHIISDIQTRIARSPKGLGISEESRPNAEENDLLSRSVFEVDGDGNLVRAQAEEESRLVQALSLNTFVLVRITCPRAMASLAKLSSAAESLLGDARSVDEKLEAFGPMQDNGGGGVTGYAGGGGYEFDEFLETRGCGPGTLVPEIEADAALCIMEGRVREPFLMLNRIIMIFLPPFNFPYNFIYIYRDFCGNSLNP